MKEFQEIDRLVQEEEALEAQDCCEEHMGGLEFSDDEAGGPVKPVAHHVNEHDGRPLLRGNTLAHDAQHTIDESTTEEDGQGYQKNSEDRSEGPWGSSLMMAAVLKLETEFADAVGDTDALDMEGLDFIGAEQELGLNSAVVVLEVIGTDVAVDRGAGDHVLAAVGAPGTPW